MLKKITIFVLITVLIVSGGSFLDLTYNYSENYSDEVVPIEWDQLEEVKEGDDEYNLIKEIMLNSSKYILSTWYQEKGYDQTTHSIDFNGTNEHHIRGPGMAALGLAIPLATNNFDESTVGIPYETALNRTLLLIKSLANSHYSNDKEGWGYAEDNYHWQTPLWSYYTGFSGWLLWEHFDEEDQKSIQNMVEWEANHIPEPRYYKDANGNVLYDGNTQAEENSSWVSLLGLAISMMPNHQNAEQWTQQLIDLALVAFASPQDIEDTKVYNGRTLTSVLAGSNIENNGTVVNHGFMHPIYMLTIEQNINVALMFSLAQIEVPEAIFHNTAKIYNALTDLHFSAEDYLSPGGTIYRVDSSAIYYPEGNDWGKYFPLYFGQIDVLAGIFNFDTLSTSEASYWSKLHNEEQLRLQNRFKDGRTYKSDEENNYKSKEERIAQIASSTFLAKWLEAQDVFDVSDASYENIQEVYKPLKQDIRISGISIIASMLLLVGSGLLVYFSKR